MLTDKQIKKKYLPIFSKNPDKYFPTSMKDLGFTRKNCVNCKRFFWSVDEKNLCGEPKCSGGFRFIDDTPAKKKMDYIEVWENFSKLMKKQGYTSVKRYPVPARWRDDLYFVEASIDNFMPYVINGVTEPPAEYVIVPQPCLRFNDIDSTGLTGAHYTCFVMIGQLTFQKPQNYNFNNYLMHLMKWFTDGLRIPVEEITLHEDVWAGSGNFGNSLEFFSRGLELANQVYMQYSSTKNGYENLGLKVLDMGLGQERNAWFSTGSGSSYETTFPSVIKKLKSQTGIIEDREIIKKFLPYASYLNIDEIENVEKTWNEISNKINYDAILLKKSILPLSALYSIAEHTRNLLIAINDGALPSNTSGGYNLRIILRRALSFIDKYGWDIDLSTICKIHANYLKPMFPELNEKLNDLDEILKVEKERYENTKSKSKQLISQIVKKNITEEKLFQLYDSFGINPETIKKQAKKFGKDIKIPDDFYAKISEKHIHIKKHFSKIKKINAPATKLLYYENQNKKEFRAKVLKIIDNKYVVLDKTCFYPRGGGQEPDYGFLGNSKVYDVEKYDNVIVHFVENISFKEGDSVYGKIDWQRRKQLTKHHTATHIVNSVSIKVLGNHVFQAGAFKGEDKAHIDLTHYKNLTEEEIEKIENLSNKIIQDCIKVKINWMKRSVAEKIYGFNIYQGGAVPGKEIRIVNILGRDVQACGGTHLENTKDAGKVIITKTKKIQDGIIRIEYVAGNLAKKEEIKQKKILEECQKILGVEKNLIEKTQELFEKWKSSKKEKQNKIKENMTQEIKNIKNKFVNNILIEKLETDMKYLQEVSKNLSNENSLIILFGVTEKTFVFCSVGKNRKENAGEIVKEICEKLNGKGGGSKNLGQGIGQKENFNKIVNQIKKRFLNE